MIPLNFQITPNMNVIVPKIFIANKILPLAIQIDETDTSGRIYKLLFRVIQDIDESDIFFEVRYKCEDELDRKHIIDRSIYIENIKKDKEKFAAFKEIMKEFDKNKFYVGSFNFFFENGNYYIDGVKQLFDRKTGAIFYETIRIYIPRYMHIMLSIYNENLLDAYAEDEKEIIFASNDMRSMRFEKVEEVELVGTEKKLLDDGSWLYSTMYDMSSGPTHWKFTYDVITPEDLNVKEPMQEEIFEARFSVFNNRYIATVRNNNLSYYILLNIDGEYKALVVNNLLINKTNLVDPYYIFVDTLTPQEEKEDDNINLEENVDSFSNWDSNVQEVNIFMPGEVEELMKKGIIDENGNPIEREE